MNITDSFKMFDGKPLIRDVNNMTKYGIINLHAIQNSVACRRFDLGDAIVVINGRNKIINGKIWLLFERQIEDRNYDTFSLMWDSDGLEYKPYCNRLNILMDNWSF